MANRAEIRVCVDIGNTRYRVAVGLSDGSILDKFDLAQTAEGLKLCQIRSNQSKNRKILYKILADFLS